VMDLVRMNPTFEIATSRQQVAQLDAQQARFAEALRDASADADPDLLERKVNEVLAVTFIGPLLAEAIGNGKQVYFVNSRSEQAYARQLYLEIAGRIGASGRLPIGKQIAAALQRSLAARPDETGR